MEAHWVVEVPLFEAQLPPLPSPHLLAQGLKRRGPLADGAHDAGHGHPGAHEQAQGLGPSDRHGVRPERGRLAWGGKGARVAVRVVSEPQSEDTPAL